MRITGYSSEEVAQLKHSLLDFHAHYQDEFMRGAERLLAGQPLNQELEITDRHGQVRWLHLEAHPVWDEAHTRIERIYGVVQEITERKQLEQYLLRAERLSAMGRLAAALAHEINNPLQAILSNLELAMDFPLSEMEQREHLRSVRQEIKRLAGLTGQILNFARPGKLALRPLAPEGVIRAAVPVRQAAATTADHRAARTGRARSPHRGLTGSSGTGLPQSHPQRHRSDA